ncbi:hypothetical protein AOZ06_17660 [Kibdelosporangium phytohabitans]|uniref:Uncharacterized protein n=1 Tax=Kibdelosporangium phytohabitans TaxID=860235 RepID=A0A0N9I1D7_9PSEU|nr:hypothetical protein AOZ06_17660 [Kibdelosporangium phytohabitans]
MRQRSPDRTTTGIHSPDHHDGNNVVRPDHNQHDDGNHDNNPVHEPASARAGEFEREGLLRR